jgi:HSP20 family molecular chaperone IbpA
MKQTSNPLPNVKIVALAPAEQTRRIHAAIARRAYESFEQRGPLSWHELEDWRQAEVRSELCFGLTTRDHAILVGTDVAGFEPGTVELWVAPRQITLSGQAHSYQAQTIKTRLRPGESIVFREIPLPYEIDPERVDTKMRGRFLEIKLPKARPQQLAKQANAA